jgi:hypothetical protein
MHRLAFGDATARSIHVWNVGGRYLSVLLSGSPDVCADSVFLCSRKLKCDKGSPCSNCTKISRPCVFITSDLDVDAQKRLAEVKEKMGVLERSLEEDVARLGHSRAADNLENPKPSTIPGQDEGHSDKEDDEDVRDLDASSYATLDAAYYDDDDDGDNDDMVDLGIAMGKVRITERIGGLVRPRLSEEVSPPQAIQLSFLTCVLL